MALNIKDPTLLSQIDQLSRVRRSSKMDVLRDLLAQEIERQETKLSVKERLAPVIALASSLGKKSTATVRETKEFFNKEWGEE